MAATMLERLFAPGNIGSMTLRNRIVMSPMVDNLGTAEGYVTKAQVGYYEARAKGGAGLVIVGASAIDFPRGKGLKRNLAVDDDKHLPGLAELAGAIKRHGARAAIQLHHAGREAKRAIIETQPIAPSAVMAPPTIWGAPYEREVPRALTVAEIAEIVAQFADAVARCRRAGFEGVEFHGNSAYLIDQFLSAASNHRDDEYGGSVENRARFLVEILRASKAQAGPDFPLWCRLTVREYGIDGGISPEEAGQFARIVKQAGADAVNTSVFVYGQSTKLPPPTAQQPGFLSRFAARIKEAVDLPVIAAGGIDPRLGEELLQTGKADFIGMGRGLIADPELPQKAAAGAFDDITPCISCMVCHDRVTKRGLPVECTVNPRVGRENDTTLTPADHKKSVLVIGGGPAGMQAALIAAARGHRVALAEKGEQLGGVMVIGSLPPHKPHLPTFTGYLARKVEQAGVSIALGKTVDAKVIDELMPDAVVLAAGAAPKIPPISGIEDAKVLFPSDVLPCPDHLGAKVCIIGGGDVGCEVAEYLADLGRQVTIVELLPEIAAEMPFALGPLMRGRLADKGVTVFTGAACEAISRNQITIHTANGARQWIRADAIVLATGGRPKDDLLPLLQSKVAAVHVAGDCARVGTIRDAVSSGYEIGMRI